MRAGLTRRRAEEEPASRSGADAEDFRLAAKADRPRLFLYKSNTIRRRIERRMNLHQIEGPAQYIRYLQETPHEIDFLFKELLISVTNFFRDPEAFEALEKVSAAGPAEVPAGQLHLSGLGAGLRHRRGGFLSRHPDARVRSRPPGRHLDVQIFGTDLDNEAIESARNGQYPAGIAAMSRRRAWSAISSVATAPTASARISGIWRYSPCRMSLRIHRSPSWT